MRAAVSIGINGRVPDAHVRALAPRVEALGFHGLWVNDVPGGDSLAALRAAVGVTSTLALATGVLPLDRRPAASLDLDGLPAERLVLGIGSGGAARPLGLVESAVEDLRGRTRAQLVVGALGPRMRRLGARRADGVLLNWLSPTGAREAMGDLHADAAAGERVATAVAPRGILYVRTIVDDAALPALRAEASAYAGYPAYAANFERQGIEAIEATLRGPDRLGDFDVVDELVLRAITPRGDLADLERFVDVAAGWLAA